MPPSRLASAPSPRRGPRPTSPHDTLTSSHSTPQHPDITPQHPKSPPIAPHPPAPCPPPRQGRAASDRAGDSKPLRVPPGSGRGNQTLLRAAQRRAAPKGRGRGVRGRRCPPARCGGVLSAATPRRGALPIAHLVPIPPRRREFWKAAAWLRRARHSARAERAGKLKQNQDVVRSPKRVRRPFSF